MSLEVADGPTRPSAVICDVDGTLCDVRAIQHHVEKAPRGSRPKPSFELFHAESINCPAHGQVVQILSRARAAGHAVLIVTGREAKWSFLTSTWLREHGVAYDELIMRGAKDYRADSIVKKEIALEIAARYRPVIAIDDRPEIIEIWQQEGIPTVRILADGAVGDIVWPKGSTAQNDLRDLMTAKSRGN